jgi:hypothetical protein
MKHELGPITVGHIGLNVSDLEISKTFYQEVLGMRVTSESLEFPVKFASLTWQGKIVLTLWEQSAGRFKKRRAGLHHLAFEADSVREIRGPRGSWKTSAHIGLKAPSYPQKGRDRLPSISRTPMAFELSSTLPRARMYPCRKTRIFP